MAWWITADARGLEDWILEVRRALAAVKGFPSSGRLEPSFGPKIARSLLVDPYRLIYVHVPGSDAITVVDFRHVRRERAKGHLDLLK